MEHQLNSLIEMGFSEREARLYIAMLQSPDISALELQKLTGVSRTKVYEILCRMVDRKICIERQVDGSNKYTAVSPRIIADRWRQRMQHQSTTIETLQESLEAMYNQGQQQPASIEYIELMKTVAQTSERFSYLCKHGCSELLVFTKAPTQSKLEIADQNTCDALAAGQLLRSLYDYESGADPKFEEYLPRWQEKGEQQRFIPSLPMKMAIFDRFYVLISMLEPGRPEALRTLCISNHELALTFHLLFDHLWETGITYEEFLKIREDIRNNLRNRHTKN